MSKPQRLMFLDVARGIAVLWMIQVHITNQLIDPALRSSYAFRALNLSNGYVAPTFMFCAGAGLWIALSRKGNDYLAFGGALWDYLRRLGFILMWAYLLHVPYFSLERWLVATPSELLPGLQIDVLQTIVYSSLFMLGVFLVVRRLQTTTWIAGVLAVAGMVGSSLVWQSDPSAWAHPLIAYAIGPQSPFPILPWAVYVFSGVAIGGLLMQVENRVRAAGWMMALGTVVPAIIFMIKWMPFDSPYDATWWQTSPGVHIFRVCGTLTLLGMLMVLEARMQESRVARFLQVVGNESLFMYISHLLIVYGAVGEQLRDGLGIAQSGYGVIAVAWVLVTVPLLVMMHWWHTFKRNRPERARDFLAVEVCVLIAYFIVIPASFSFTKLLTP